MKFKRLIMLLGLIVILTMAGCGSESGGGLNLNGSLTISAPTVDNADPSISVVTFTTTYTNPQKSDLLGMQINFSISEIGDYTVRTNNSGSVIQRLFFGKGAVPRTIFITASTGDLQASAAASIPVKNVALTANPATLAFQPISSLQIPLRSQITGGTGSYTATKLTDTLNAIFANMTTVNLIQYLQVKKTALVHSGTATVKVSDTATPPATVTVPVNY